VSVELDEGARGMDGSWIESDLVKRAGLKTRQIVKKERFKSRLFPGQEFVPQEEVDVRLIFEPADVEVTLKCYVLPVWTESLQRCGMLM